MTISFKTSLYNLFIHYLVLCLLTLSGCASSQPIKKDSLLSWQNIDKSVTFAQNHTGFALFDVEKKEMVAQHQADRYFTPASNTKLYTLFAGLSMLGDSLPSLRYVIKGDSLIFWGTGSPTLLHPDFANDGVLDFLKRWSGKLFYYPNSYTGRRFGAGWAWSEYDEYYQPELSGLPIYGNIVRFTNKSVSPKIFKDSLKTSAWSADFELRRDEFTNSFYSKGWPSKPFEQDVPFRTSATQVVQLLADTLKKNVMILPKIAPNIIAKTLKGMPVDTVYRRMLQISDNMLAEQILLMCAAEADSLNAGFDSRKGIDFVKNKFMQDMPDAAVWVDGSGLSRYNLFTPRTTVKLLQKIYEKVPQQRIFGLLAIGGKAGTIRSQYKGNAPFVFAKTGTLSNNYSLSGYLTTKSGKVLIFSFMNSNYVRPTSEIRKEVERILTDIHEKY